VNVVFHTISAIGVVAMVTDTNIVKPGNGRAPIAIAATALLSAVFFHGVLDYMPHCYPVHSKWDVLAGLCVIISVFLWVRNNYRLIVAAAFVGCVLPDVVDLLPAILNKYMGWQLPLKEKVFPWHWKENSGSIYSGNCETSFINHWFVVIFVLSLIYARRYDLKQVFR